MSTIEIIDIGALANDGTGDPLRTAFQKINNNFSILNATTFTTSTEYTQGNSTQAIFTVPVSGFTQGIFQIRSSNVASQDSQDITLSAQIKTDLTGVKFVGYSTTFSGTPLTNYDMDVLSGNVRVLINSLSTGTMLHFISAQVTYDSPADTPGLLIAPDGWPVDYVLATESGLQLETG